MIPINFWTFGFVMLMCLYMWMWQWAVAKCEKGYNSSYPKQRESSRRQFHNLTSWHHWFLHVVSWVFCVAFTISLVSH